MSSTILRLAGAGLFFLGIFLSGFWLSHSGKPYNALIFNLHKFIVLAAVFFFVMTVIRMNQVMKLNTVELTACSVTAFLFLIAIISGGLVSIPKTMPAALTTLHHLLPYLTVLSAAVTLYLLLHRT